MVIEYETVEMKTWYELFDEDDFQAYLICPFDVEKGHDLKFAWMTSQNYHMMNAKDVE